MDIITEKGFSLQVGDVIRFHGNDYLIINISDDEVSAITYFTNVFSVFTWKRCEFCEFFNHFEPRNHLPIKKVELDEEEIEMD